MATGDGPSRVPVAEDHPVYADGLAAAIERADDLELASRTRASVSAQRGRCSSATMLVWPSGERTVRPLAMLRIASATLPRAAC